MDNIQKNVAAIHELRRYPSPAPQPHALCHDRARVWISSRETRRIYGVDVKNWTLVEENPIPGMAWGMTVAGDDLYAVCGEPPDDDRYIRRYVKGAGFAEDLRKPCPDGTGSYLAFDGSRLILTQWYARRVLYLDRSLDVEREVEAHRGICGATFADGAVYLVTTADESTDDYWLSRVIDGDRRPTTIDVARIPFKARALAWDGERFWTNHRERDEIVAFDFSRSPAG